MTDRPRLLTAVSVRVNLNSEFFSIYISTRYREQEIEVSQGFLISVEHCDKIYMNLCK